MASQRLLKLEVQDYILNTYLGQFFEIMAAITGAYYLRKGVLSKTSRLFVYFLWITVIIDLIGAYAPIGYFSEYRYFGFVKDTPFRANYWLFNLYLIFSYSFYTYYFRSYIRSKILRAILGLVLVIFVISSGINLMVSDIFFKGYSQFITLFGALIILSSVLLFYFELLQSNQLLQLKSFLPFYVSIGILMFTLCTAPIDIFSEYFSISSGNKMFVDLSTKIFLFANIFLYTTYVIGFIICSRRKKYS